MDFLRRFLRWRPVGYTLVRLDGTIHNRLRGDMIPVATVVIVEDRRYFVDAHEADDDGFVVYREGHATFQYQSMGA